MTAPYVTNAVTFGIVSSARIKSVRVAASNIKKVAERKNVAVPFKNATISVLRAEPEEKLEP